MKKTLKGKITSIKRDKTATVEVVRKWKHPLYKKYVKKTKKYSCHYEGMKLELGDEVVIVACAPISKTKHFKILEKVKVILL